MWESVLGEWRICRLISKDDGKRGALQRPNAFNLLSFIHSCRLQAYWLVLPTARVGLLHSICWTTCQSYTDTPTRMLLHFLIHSSWRIRINGHSNQLFLNGIYHQRDVPGSTSSVSLPVHSLVSIRHLWGPGTLFCPSNSTPHQSQFCRIARLVLVPLLLQRPEIQAASRGHHCSPHWGLSPLLVTFLHCCVMWGSHFLTHKWCVPSSTRLKSSECDHC